jgi:hypothetical protein
MLRVVFLRILRQISGKLGERPNLSCRGCGGHALEDLQTLWRSSAMIHPGFVRVSPFVLADHGIITRF